MFGLLKEAVRFSASTVAAVLGIPLYLAQEALDAGCTTLTEVRAFVKNA